MIKSSVRFILKRLFNVKVEGIENLEKAGDRVLIVANHLSFLDALLLAIFIPHKLMFAINTQIAQLWWMKPILWMIDSFRMDPTNPMAAKAMIRKIKAGNTCVIFPEGRITVTGSLMKIYEGPGMIADKSNAQIVPIRIDGAQYSVFSRLKGKARLRWFPNITLHILEPRQFDIPDEARGRKRRNISGQALYDLMRNMIFESSNYKQPLFASLIDAQKTHGPKHVIAEDPMRKPITYRQLITRSFALGKVLSKHTQTQEYVGVLLPNSVGTLVTFFALQAYNRVPAMLNFSAGVSSLVSASQTAELEHVITSRRFIEMGKLDAVISAFEERGIKILYLEDCANEVSFTSKLKSLAASYFPQWAWQHNSPLRTPEAPAVVLFTSGSEGLPKGVVLNHRNLQANRAQLAASIDFSPTDTVFNALPVFHSFGLTGGTLLPVLNGVRTFFYPSPLHFRIIPEIIYDTNATILFGTDTFLSGYARFAHPYDFYSLRYVFAGAEKLKDETRKLWSEKYGLRIFEGYGATETSPVISANSPMLNRAGSVGKIVPGITWRLEDIPGIDAGQRLFVKGPNIMHGYLLPDNPGKLIPPEDGWYDTGDIVRIDEDGYLHICGRAKRFAKIAGEMVSLTAVESFVSAAWPEHNHAVVSIPDAKKGEQLVLLTTCATAHRSELVTYAQKNGISELSLPRQVIIENEIPLLGTGKTDYVGVQEVVDNKILQKKSAAAAAA